MIVGIKVGLLVMSELGSGSDVVSMWLIVVKKGDRYILNGSKFWIINGFVFFIFVIYVKIFLEKGLKGIIVFIVERDWKGFFILLKLDKVGMCGLDMCELVFENVEILEENVLGKVNGGVVVLMIGLDLERLVLLGGLLGLM